jgi:hypothetical protein
MNSVSEDELKSYILMERILPPLNDSVLIRNNSVIEVCTDVHTHDMT